MSQAQDKWHLYGGRDPRRLPSYTTREAARYVRLPLRTVQNWAFGFRTYGGAPLIHIADPDLRDPLILSRESIRRNRSVEQTSPTGWTLHNVARLG